jgi:transposase
MKSLTTGSVVQKDLWELRRKIQLALWENPNLGIPGVIHLIYTGNITDLHSVEPYYISRLDFDVQYYDDLTGTC